MMTRSSKVAVDADIFFFSLRSDRYDIRSADVQRLLRHMSSAPSVDLYVPLTVIGESTIECLMGERRPGSRHDLSDLHDLIDFWAALDLKPLYPNEAVAMACSKFVARYRRGQKKDYRLSDTDMVHLSYALAYQMDYFLTTDSNLRHYVPAKSSLNVLNLGEAGQLLKKGL